MIASVGSVAGSPGATTFAVALAASGGLADPPTLIEADPDGGRLGAQLGMSVEPGLVDLAVTARGGHLGREDFRRCSAPMGGWALIAAPPSSEQSSSALTGARAFAAGMTSGDWIVDAGRLSPRSPTLPLATASDITILVSRGDLAHLQLLPHRVDSLIRAGCDVAVVVVEPTHWQPPEIASFVGADVLGVLPHVAGKHDLAGLRFRAWRPWWAAVERIALLITDNEQVAV